jgi:predicted RNA-binding protein with PIN domain
MSQHFILDGYNIIKQAFGKDNLSLKNEREKLFCFLDNCRPQGSPKNKVTIVFDGKEGLNHQRCLSPLEIIFSKGESADSCIKNLVERSPNPKNIVVVTDDRGLKFSVGSSGAKTMPVKEFLAKARVIKPKDLKEDKDLSFYLSNKITAELKSLWLRAK